MGVVAYKDKFYAGSVNDEYPPKKAIITLTFTSGQATTSDYINNVILAAEIAGNTITYEPTLASGAKTGYKFVARTSTMAIDTGFSGQKNLTIIYV